MIDVVEAFGATRLLVVGDCMLDCTIHGRVARISPEAPVPVVESTTTSYAAGGAANVALNAARMGADVALVGVIGDDEEGRRLCRLLEAEVDVTGLVADPRRPTTTKTRVVAHAQQVVRVDRESREPVDEALAARLTRLAGDVAAVDAIVVSDYAKGVVTPDVARPVVQLALRRGLPVIVDPKSLDGRYAGATVVTPNKHEAAAQVGGRMGDADDEDVLARAAALLLDRHGFGAVLVTRGADGMTLFEPDATTAIPAHAREAYDVTGAGDTVVAVLALGLAAGGSLADCARLASAAAGIAVGKLGTATVLPAELRAALADEWEASRR
jgi:D-beta-D-heptose 7-phosphate kinase/D-beta-D-heptose 1-phosphate adenosyltransferase